MEESILKSVKKILGLPEDYTPFDADVIMHINSSLATMTQIGVGPVHGFVIDDDTAKWEDLNLPQDQLSTAKTYISLKTRMLFDPPGTSYLIDAMTSQIDEHLWRLSTMRETALGDTEPELPPSGGDSASGVQLTPAFVWVMDYTLGFVPAAFKFFELDSDTEMEPEEIQYVNTNRSLALWPIAIAGRWRAS